MILTWPRRAAPGERALAAALGVWERRLVQESLRRWLIRGATGSLIVGGLVLLVGWVVPQPEEALRPWAFELGSAPLLAALLVALWPRRHIRRAAELDSRLRFGDRLTTAWSYRRSAEPIVALQRSDAIERLGHRSPRTELNWRPARAELIALGALTVLALVLLITPSPQQVVLDRQAAEQLAVQQTSEQLDAVRQDVVNLPSLTPDQARQLDELLQQAQAELNRTKTQQQATAILARTQDQLTQQLVDPNADLRNEALAAMSETLAAEPQTQALGDAIQHEDPQAASDALNALSSNADQLSTIERQALSRALQRAANVGRADQRTASALRDAAQALTNGSSADQALSAADAALRDSLQASQAQASLSDTSQRLRQLQAQLASGTPLPRAGLDEFGTPGARVNPFGTQTSLLAGTPVALDAASTGSRAVQDPAPGDASGAGYASASSGTDASGNPAAQSAENVFVPGRSSNGAADQNLTDQPFTVRGAPRPYRDVLSQYAQSSRDYVDRPDISPAVRDMVKQYFQSLEEGQ